MTSLTIPLIYALLASICYTQDIYLGANEPQRETKCSQAECKINCLATQCGNELIKATRAGGIRGSWVEEMKITMNCQEKYTCGGEIIIDGERKHVKSKATIRCDENPKKSCYGGQYVLTELNQGILIGDATQTDILFKNMGRGDILIPKKEDEENTPPEQFLMNRVWTENINQFHLRTHVEGSAMASYFDLTGVAPFEEEVASGLTRTGRVRRIRIKESIHIDCLAPHSCVGSIFVFKKCGGTAVIRCGLGACAWMSILVLNMDCGSTIYGTERKPLVRVISTVSHEEPRTIFAVCPAKHRGFCVGHQSDPEIRDSVITFGIFPDTKQWLDGMNVALQALNNAYDKITEASKRDKPNQWIREDGHVNYLAGVMFEAAIGSFLSAPATVGGLTVKKLVSGSLATGLGIGLGSVAWPLIIPGLVVAGVGGVIYLRKKALTKKYKIPRDFKAFSGHVEIYNEYEDEINPVDYAYDYSILDPAAHFDDLINGKMLYGAHEMDDMSMDYANMNMNAYNSNISHDNMLLAVLLAGIFIVLCGILILKFVCVGCLGFISKRKYKPYDRKYEEVEV